MDACQETPEVIRLYSTLLWRLCCVTCVMAAGLSPRDTVAALVVLAQLWLFFSVESPLIRVALLGVAAFQVSHLFLVID